MPKMKLSFLDLLDWVQFVIKTIQENNVINHTSLVYVETKTELLRPIKLGMVCYKNMIDRTSVVYGKNQMGQRHD